MRRSQGKTDEKARRRRSRQPKVRWTLGKTGNWLFMFLMIGQSLVGANAASDETQCRSGPMIRLQQETEVKVSSWEIAIPKRSQQKVCLVVWVGMEHREEEHEGVVPLISSSELITE